MLLQNLLNGNSLSNEPVESHIKAPPHLRIEMNPANALGRGRGVIDAICQQENSRNPVEHDVLHVEELPSDVPESHKRHSRYLGIKGKSCFRS